MAVVTFKTGMVAEMFNWSLTEGYIYLPSWVREIGSMMQVMPLLVIPFVGIIQSCRYFLHGPDNILEVNVTNGVTFSMVVILPNYLSISINDQSVTETGDVVSSQFLQTRPEHRDKVQQDDGRDPDQLHQQHHLLLLLSCSCQ